MVDEPALEDKVQRYKELRAKAAEAEHALHQEIRNRQASIRRELNILGSMTETQSTPEELIRNYVLLSVGAGILPFPVIDLAALTGIQLRMLYKLSEMFGVQFSEHRVRHLVTALVGGAGAGLFATGPVASLLKMIPVVGQLGGVAAMPVVGGASTYAVGYLFLEHFKTGGTFETLDLEKARKAIETLKKEGEASVARGKTAKVPAAATAAKALAAATAAKAPAAATAAKAPAAAT
jgi:uncharacterized protein (DUF697 family)